MIDDPTDNMTDEEFLAYRDERLAPDPSITQLWEDACDAEMKSICDSARQRQLLKIRQKRRAPLTTPFSMRLSAEERAELNILAGTQAWAAYIRAEIFGDKARKRRVLRKPAIDDRKVSMVLSALGESRLSQNLNQLAKHANMGTLDVSEPVEQEIVDACKAVTSMREVLLSALGHKA